MFDRDAFVLVTQQRERLTPSAFRVVTLLGPLYEILGYAEPMVSGRAGSFLDLDRRARDVQSSLGGGAG